MAIPSEDILKLLIAVLLGGIIGIERELGDKPAGLRTMILICVGATMFTIFSVRIAGPDRDPARIAAQIVTGVGFLGAGAILRDRRQVIGLTTAALIWLVASIGIGVGIAQYSTAVAETLVILGVLLVLRRLDLWIDRRRDDHFYEVVVARSEDLGRVREMLSVRGVTVVGFNLCKGKEELRLRFRAIGPRATLEKLGETLVAEPAVVSFTRD